MQNATATNHVKGIQGFGAWCGLFGSLLALCLTLALGAALWFTGMLFLVRGLVDAASSPQMTTAEATYEAVDQQRVW
jgi:hypothetical protein